MLMLKLLEINTYTVEYLPLGNTSNRTLTLMIIDYVTVCVLAQKICINYYVITESDVYTCIYMYIAETDSIGSDSPKRRGAFFEINQFGIEILKGGYLVLSSSQASVCRPHVQLSPCITAELQLSGLRSWDGFPVQHPNFLRPESYSSAAISMQRVVHFDCGL